MDNREAICGKFNLFTKNLVRANLHRQKKIRETGLSAKAMAKEFCTVRMLAGRGSGATYTACDMALNMFRNPLLLVHNHAAIKIVKERLKRTKIVDPQWISNIHVQSINGEESLRGLDPDSVIIDAASLASQSKIENIYDLFSHLVLRRDFCFIILG